MKVCVSNLSWQCRYCRLYVVVQKSKIYAINMDITNGSFQFGTLTFKHFCDFFTNNRLEIIVLSNLFNVFNSSVMWHISNLLETAWARTSVFNNFYDKSSKYRHSYHCSKQNVQEQLYQCCTTIVHSGNDGIQCI